MKQEVTVRCSRRFNTWFGGHEVVCSIGRMSGWRGVAVNLWSEDFTILVEDLTHLVLRDFYGDPED